MSDLFSRVLEGLQALVLAIVGAIGGAGADQVPTFHGYVEGEYVRVAARAAGTLEQLPVARGDRVRAGDLLFVLDATEAQAARDQAAADLASAKARLADLRKGKRDPEIDLIQAQKAQAEAMRALSEVHLRRQQKLVGTAAASQEELDAARASYQRDQARVTELEAALEVAQLAGREDELAAAEAAVDAAQAAVTMTQWRLDERKESAPAAALVTDTLYRVGEHVAAGSPVVELLPPDNVKLRFFVPESLVSALQVGDQVGFACDGCPGDLGARISFIAPEAEYTPPVIYSRESREKLVFLVEALPEEASPRLHPGQPVDVWLGTS